MGAWAFLIHAPPAPAPSAPTPTNPPSSPRPQPPPANNSKDASPSIMRRALNFVVGSSPDGKKDGAKGSGEVVSYFRGAPDVLVEGAGFMWCVFCFLGEGELGYDNNQPHTFTHTSEPTQL